MTEQNPEAYATLLYVIEMIGTFAFAISGIRMAAAKNYDWFGAFCCGFAVAVGGGTMRDVMLGTTPFWMTTPDYIICNFISLLVVAMFFGFINRIYNTWLHIFDTLGLALFTIAGMQKSMEFDQPFWVAIIMGAVTGAGGGVIRDVLLNEIPLIFRKEIYAMAAVIGGSAYYLMRFFGVEVHVASVLTFFAVMVIRLAAVKYHIQLPVLTEKK